MDLVQLAEQGTTASNGRGFSLVVVVAVLALLGFIFVPRVAKNGKQAGAGVLLVVAFIVFGVIVVVVSTRG